MSLILSKFGKLNNFVQNGRSICAYRYFSIATNGCREVELNYLDKNAQGVAVIGLNRPSAKNAFSRTDRYYSTDKNFSNVELNYLKDDCKGIAVIGIERPAARNALNRQLIAKLTTAANELVHRTDIRCVILRSLVPGTFCAGADLIERATLSPTETRQYSLSLRTVLTTIEQLPMPVIAALDGTALGGGLELALTCDIITAVTTAKIGLVETSRAIIPGAGGTQRLPRRLGPSLAKELIFTSRILNGTDAEQIGICNYAVEPNISQDAAYQNALEIAREILPNGPIGVRLAKQAINRGLDVDLNTGLAIEEACYAQTIPTKDRTEGLKAFAEKRKPNYKGE